MRRPGNINEFAHNVIPLAEPGWMLTLGLTLSPEHEGALSRRTMAELADCCTGRALRSNPLRPALPPWASYLVIPYRKFSVAGVSGNAHRELVRAMAFPLSGFRSSLEHGSRCLPIPDFRRGRPARART